MSGAEGEGVTVTEHLRLPRRRESYVWPRDDADWYVEPTWCSIRLFAVESFVGHVHDPAAGMGRIVEAARAHGLPATGADIVDRSFGFMVQDFALATEPVDNRHQSPVCPGAPVRRSRFGAGKAQDRHPVSHSPAERGPVARGHVVPAALAAHPTAQYATG